MAKPLVDAEDFRQRVRRARSMTPEERLLEGARIFDEEVARERAKLRVEHPQATEDEIARLVCQLYDERRRVEEVGLYVPVPPGTPCTIRPPPRDSDP